MRQLIEYLGCCFTHLGYKIQVTWRGFTVGGSRNGEQLWWLLLWWGGFCLGMLRDAAYRGGRRKQKNRTEKERKREGSPSPHLLVPHWFTRCILRLRLPKLDWNTSGLCNNRWCIVETILFEQKPELLIQHDCCMQKGASGRVSQLILLMITMGHRSSVVSVTSLSSGITTHFKDGALLRCYLRTEGSPTNLHLFPKVRHCHGIYHVVTSPAWEYSLICLFQLKPGWFKDAFSV